MVQELNELDVFSLRKKLDLIHLYWHASLLEHSLKMRSIKMLEIHLISRRLPEEDVEIDDADVALFCILGDTSIDVD
jgi:hypothetical protein